MSNTLDEIEKLFELGETAKACNMIEALITEAYKKGYIAGGIDQLTKENK